MILVLKANLPLGDYVFFYLDVFGSSLQSDQRKPWFRGDADDALAKEAYKAVMIITYKEPDNPEYEMFVEEVKTRALKTYNFSINNSLCYRDLTLINRDGMNIVLMKINQILMEKFLRLQDTCRSQMVWLVRELVKSTVIGADGVCMTLMKQIAGGDVSLKNIWLAENVLDILVDQREWVLKSGMLIAMSVYTYLRLIVDHHGTPALLSLRQKEVDFCIGMLRERFMDCFIIGRDLVRLLQNVARIPEFELLWKDLLHNPQALSPQFTGVLQLLSSRTSRKFLACRLTPDMETKLLFMTSRVRFGQQKRYQDWFQRQYLSTPDSQSLRCDLIRYICGVVHPSNEVLSSDILPRWAIIGWLLTTCTSNVAASNAKLALFYDWLFFNPDKDSIMNIVKLEESVSLEMDNHASDKEDGCYDNTEAAFSDDEEELNSKGKSMVPIYQLIPGWFQRIPKISSDTILTHWRIPSASQQIPNTVNLCQMQEDNSGFSILLDLLAELYQKQPKIGYHLLYYLKASKAASGKMSLYESFAQATALGDLHTCLMMDMKACQEDDVRLLCYLTPSIYSEFPDETLRSGELLNMIVAVIDSTQLQELMCHVMMGNLVMFRKDSVLNILIQSLDWETFEQYSTWQLFLAHNIPLETIIPILQHLKYKEHPEALSCLLLQLRRENLRSSSSKLAQLTLEQILEHLDNLRLSLINTKQNFFNQTPILQALQHVQASCDEAHKMRFSDLFSLAEEYEDSSSKPPKSRRKATVCSPRSRKGVAQPTSNEEESASSSASLLVSMLIDLLCHLWLVGDVSPVLAGFIGAGVLVVSVSLAVFVWTCCHRRYQKSLSSGHGGDPGSDPPYKFIHMLKGISIYPETLSNSKKIVRVARRAGELRAASGNYRSDWAHNNTVLVDAAENGLLSPSPTQGSRPLVCPSQQRLEQQLPLRADYSQGLSPDPSLSSSTTGSKTPSPFTPSDGTEEAKLGTLSFSVDYNFPKKALVVTIQEAHGLPAVDEQASSSDPYIKMTILPEKKHRVKTRVLRKTLDPVFDETFTFYGVPFSGLQELVLHFLVLSFDRFSRDDVIGEVVVPLSGVDPSTGRVQLRHDIVKRNIQVSTHFLYHSNRTPINMSIEVITIDQRTVTYRVVSMPGDGTYLFHSLCDILHGHIRLTLDIRRNIVSYVLNDCDRFKVWIDDGTGANYTTQEHYKSEMLKPFTYGSACELMAAAELFGCRFKCTEMTKYFTPFDNRLCLLNILD
ncbi:INT3 protein, partial [Polypterus senegalus]